MPPRSVAQAAGAGESPRLALAHLALDAALGVPDVLGGEADPAGLRVTADLSAGLLLRGVSVTAEADGRYAIDLRLLARVVPLVPLGDEIERRVQARADRDGLADQVGPVRVEFARVLTPEDVERERTARDQLEVYP
jgi:hypothetical protein